MQALRTSFLNKKTFLPDVEKNQHQSREDACDIEFKRNLLHGYVPRCRFNDTSMPHIVRDYDQRFYLPCSTDEIRVLNTYNYMKNIVSVGIFVAIRDGYVHQFIPFRNNHFVNDWGSEFIQVDPNKYRNLSDFLAIATDHANQLNNTRFYFNEDRISLDPTTWTCNNHIFRPDRGAKCPTTNNTGIGDCYSVYLDMLITVCHRLQMRNMVSGIPDLDLFINVSDSPILTRNGADPYYHIYGLNRRSQFVTLTTPLCPIVGGSGGSFYSDIAIPNTDDWLRARKQQSIHMTSRCNYPHDSEYIVDWSKKIHKMVFRGTDTGYGYNVDTNLRIKIVSMFQDVSDSSTFDIGFTKLRARIRKDISNPYLQLLDLAGIRVKEEQTLVEQSKAKFLLNIDGHAASYQLSQKFGSGSCVLHVGLGIYHVWYQPYLIPDFHYILVDVNKLDELQNFFNLDVYDDEKYRNIAQNGLKFYRKFLQVEGIVDFFAEMFRKLA